MGFNSAFKGLNLVFKKLDRAALTELVPLRTRTIDRLLWMSQWTFGFYKTLGIYWIAEEMMASQEGLCSIELFSSSLHGKRNNNPPKFWCFPSWVSVTKSEQGTFIICSTVRAPDTYFYLSQLEHPVCLLPPSALQIPHKSLFFSSSFWLSSLTRLTSRTNKKASQTHFLLLLSWPVIYFQLRFKLFFFLVICLTRVFSIFALIFLYILCEVLCSLYIHICILSE